MGLDVRIVMVRNRKQVEEDNFWNLCKTGFVKDEEGIIDFSQPCEVYYARKFWDLYSPAAHHFKIENGEFSGPLTRDDLEYLIDLAVHNPDYWDSFSSVPILCEILYHYDEIKDAGMILLFEGDY